MKISNVRLIRTLSLCMLLFPFYLYGQSPSYSRFHFTDENGFLQNTSYRIGVNKLGYAWVLSEYGLARLDGTHIKNYLNTTYFNSPNRKFSSMLWDHNGNIYACEDTTKYNFFKLQIHPENIAGPAHSFFSSTFHQLLFLKDVPKSSRKAMQELLKSNNHFYFTPLHELYIFETEKVNYSDDNHAPKSISLSSPFQAIPAGDHIIIFRDDHAVYSLYKGELTEHKNSNATQISELITGSIVVVNTSGTFILKNNQLHQLFISNGIPTLQLMIDNLNVQDVSDVFWEATMQTMVVSSSTDGVYVFKKQYFRSILSPLSHTYINNFYAQTELSDGSIFSANAVVDSKGTISPQNKIKDSDQSALLTDSNKNIYLSYNNGLFKTDETFQHLKKITDVDGPVRSLILHHDTIWFADHAKIGYIFNDLFFESYPGISAARSHLPDITTLFKDSYTTWIGTENGLYIMKGDQTEPESIAELRNKRVSYITTCSGNSIFIGTKGQGCFIYKNGTYTSMPMDKNNALSTVNAAIADQNGFLWITTNRGLLKASIKEIEKFAAGKAETVYYYYYYKEEGFATNEFNNANTSPVIIKRNGLFSFSSLKGLVWFNPSDIKPGYFPGHIFIDELTIDDSLVKPASEIELPSTYTNFNVKVSVPYWGNRNNLELSYALSDKELKWYPVDESGFIHFTKLPNGSYTLLIKARAGYGDQEVLITKLYFNVLPAWYETTIFRFALIVLFLLTVYWIFRLRLAGIERERLHLDGVVKEKTRELKKTIRKLSDTVAELTESQDELNKVVEQKEKLTSILAHDLRTPLKFMTMLSEYLNKNISSLPPEKMHALTAELMTSSKGTFTFADELLTWLSLQKQNFRVIFYEESIKRIIDEQCVYFSDIANAKNTQLIIQAKDEIFAMTDERLLKVILRNLLDNAIKNTTDGKIIINVAKTQTDELEIEIKDSGKGMTTEQLREINTNNAYGFSFEIKEKLGFQIIKDFTYKLNGTIEVKSELGKGTTVFLRFPAIK